MKKQVIYLATTALLTLGLAACSSGKQEQAKTSSSQKTSQVKKASHKKAEQKSSSSQSAKKQAKTKNQQASVWDQSKTQQLTTFMTNWGYTMQQSYQAYSPQNPGHFRGITIPTGVYPNGLLRLQLTSQLTSKPRPGLTMVRGLRIPITLLPVTSTITTWGQLTFTPTSLPFTTGNRSP